MMINIYAAPMYIRLREYNLKNYEKRKHGSYNSDTVSTGIYCTTMLRPIIHSGEADKRDKERQR